MHVRSVALNLKPRAANCLTLAPTLASSHPLPEIYLYHLLLCTHFVHMTNFKSNTMGMGATKASHSATAGGFGRRSHRSALPGSHEGSRMAADSQVPKETYQQDTDGDDVQLLPIFFRIRRNSSQGIASHWSGGMLQGRDFVLL
ncbi:hypothetical protein PG990_000522 [Apiospora arundinis]|uniref:Uncharacterized protein n=1 Tax=Apiospora arundinis TaxID=335852 RepID=A0ABR2HZL2_9PEZI